VAPTEAATRAPTATAVPPSATVAPSATRVPPTPTSAPTWTAVPPTPTARPANTLPPPTSPPTATSTPTATPTEAATTEATPTQPLAAHITGISIVNGRYAVTFATTGYTAMLPGQHVHFFFDTVPPEQAGSPGAGPWIIHAAEPNPFTGYGVGDRPSGALQMCILVANPNHTVIPNSGNCWPLPES
jgi:hypothetical protein